MISQIGAKLRGQIAGFSGELASGHGKVASRFVQEMIYGLLASGSVRLTQIARTLNEEISMKKTHWRLCRNLANRRTAEAVAGAVLRMGAERVNRDTLLIVDPSDLRKKYARSMENLAFVRDGSEKAIVAGYHLTEVVAAEAGSPEIVPLVQTLWSSTATDFVSENDEILTAVDRVCEATKGRGVIVMDRGGDRGKLLVPWAKDPKRHFIVRLCGDRNLLFRKRPVLAEQLARDCKTPFREVVVKERRGREQYLSIDFGFRPVRLPDFPDRQLWLVVAKGFGREPMMLLTSRPLRRSRKVVWWIINAYISRWRIEETIRFIKQSYQLEDIRLLSYTRLQNMMAFVLAAAYFTAARLGGEVKLSILAANILPAAQRIFGIPNFRYYALADAILNILSAFKPPKRAREGPAPSPPLQMAFKGF